VSDLIEFIRAQLADDERVAREAGSRALTWPATGTWYLEGVEHNVVGQEEAFCHPHNVEHIARHDPARVLAEVDAKRRILDRHRPIELFSSMYCTYCGVLGGQRARDVNWPCPEILDAAAPYADRPGYRESWRP
jgi:hypothetical protein